MLCTEVEVDATGDVHRAPRRANCRGPEKARRLTRVAAGERLGDADLWAYGDCAGDRELLAWRRHPVRGATDVDRAVPRRAGAPDDPRDPLLWREARPQQWVKNVLVFAAPGAAGVLDDWHYLWRTIVDRSSRSASRRAARTTGTTSSTSSRPRPSEEALPPDRSRCASRSASPRSSARCCCSAASRPGFSRCAGSAPRRRRATSCSPRSYTPCCKHVAVVDLVAVAGGFVLRAIAGACRIRRRDVVRGSSCDDRSVRCSSSPASATPSCASSATTRPRHADDGGVHAPFLRIVLAVACGATLVDVLHLGVRVGRGQRRQLPVLRAVDRADAHRAAALPALLEQGHGGAPEEVFLLDRPLQLCVVVWVITFGLGVYLGSGTPG